MDIIGQIPSEALWAIGGVVAGYFGRLLFRDRDKLLQIAIEATAKAIGANLEPSGETAKGIARNSVIESVERELKSRGIKKGVENLARLALETVIRRRKKS